MINSLKNVANTRSCLIENNAMGVIDVTAAVGFGAQKHALDLKIPRHRADIVGWVGAHSYAAEPGASTISSGCMVFHAPRVKSGITTGALPPATE